MLKITLDGYENRENINKDSEADSPSEEQSEKKEISQSINEIIWIRNDQEEKRKIEINYL